MQGSVGNVDLSGLRPGQAVTVTKASSGGQLGTVDLTRAANITVDGIRLRSATIAGDSSTRAQNLMFRDCQAGGTSSARAVVFAVFDIRAHAQDIRISDCEIAWTGQGGADNGYGVRAVNGDQGPIANVTVERSRLHHLTADGLQLAGVSNFTLDRSEIAYCATEPGGPDTHADSIQIMSQSGTNRYTNNWIHHTGYYTDTQVPGPAGQWIMHEWASGSMLVENNLMTSNRNYTPAFSGAPSNVVLRRNTIVGNATAFGASSDDMQWSPGPGTSKVMDRNIVGGMGGGAGISFTGNVWIDSGTRALSDVGIRPVTFDASWNPLNLPVSHAGAGYRKPSNVPW